MCCWSEVLASMSTRTRWWRAFAHRRQVGRGGANDRDQLIRQLHDLGYGVNLTDLIAA